MLTREEALGIAEKHVAEMSDRTGFEYMINEPPTLEARFGWVFFYNSKDFLETGNFLSQVAGNGPLLVNKFDGSLKQGGSRESIELQIKKYEEELLAAQRRDG